MTKSNRNNYCVKSVQIRSYFWSVFSRIRTEYEVSLRIQSECGKIRTRNNSVFGHFLRSECSLRPWIDNLLKLYLPENTEIEKK